MPRSVSVMSQDIHSTLLAIDNLMAHVATQATEMGVKPTELRNMNGDWPIAQLLVARASVLSAEATLKALEKK